MSIKTWCDNVLLSLTRAKFTKEKGLCAQHVRINIWENWPKEFHPPSGLTAWQQFKWLKARGLSVPITRGSKPGDILYKMPTPLNRAGHVGVRVPENRVVENSTYHHKQTGDARGIRTIKQFGFVAGIIRPPFE